MGRKEFEASRADGVHAQLARMAGQWQGRFRLWFEPGDPAEESGSRPRFTAWTTLPSSKRQ